MSSGCPSFMTYSKYAEDYAYYIDDDPEIDQSVAIIASHHTAAIRDSNPVVKSSQVAPMEMVRSGSEVSHMSGMSDFSQD